jgi:DNA-binding response OmpR family regulator
MSRAGLLLLVDDEPEIVDVLRDYFEERGYSVMSAVNGRDALVLASLTRPDAVILDIRMPDIEGPEVLRELRALDDSIPVVMLSGTDDEALARELLQVGAFDYVRKPFVFDNLDDVMRLAVMVGKRRPVREVPVPQSVEPWTLDDDLPGVDAWCPLCQESVRPADTTAVRQRGSLFHAMCWLARSTRTPAPDRQLARH